MKSEKPLLIIGLVSLVLATSAATQEPDGGEPNLQLPKISDQYTGASPSVFPQELDLVRSYTPTVQSEIAAQLGLPYSQGFRHPVTIRFSDGAPIYNENSYFYVVTKSTGDAFSQEIVGNVQAFAMRDQTPDPGYSRLQNGFRYAMTEAMLNDLAAGSADDALPLWIQEGLAVYAAGNGDKLAQKALKDDRDSSLEEHLSDLDSPGPFLSPREFTRYYLAVSYIASTGSLRPFVANILDGKSEADTIRDTFGFDWATFEGKVRAYSLQKLSSIRGN